MHFFLKKYLTKILPCVIINTERGTESPKERKKKMEKFISYGIRRTEDNGNGVTTTKIIKNVLWYTESKANLINYIERLLSVKGNELIAFFEGESDSVLYFNLLRQVEHARRRGDIQECVQIENRIMKEFYGLN